MHPKDVSLSCEVSRDVLHVISRGYTHNVDFISTGKRGAGRHGNSGLSPAVGFPTLVVIFIP